MVRILQVLPTLNVCGGVEHYLMNYYDNVDGEVCRFDFATHAVDDPFYRERIESRGGKVYLLPPFTIKNMKAVKAGIRAIFRENEYDAVHCHQANAAYFYFKEAKKAGVACRILHSHQAAAADKFTHKIRNKPLLWLGKRYCTHRFACSALAGNYLFGKRYTLVNNAIDTEKYAFSEKARAAIRQEIGLPQDAFVVGHAGRMCHQKNQRFLLEIFGELLKERQDAYLLMLGSGELSDALKRRAEELQLGDRVKFLGNTSRAEAFYSAMDVFVLPSLYEGLPVVGVEAQCNGLPLITSENVTREVGLLDSTKFLSLGLSAKEWARAVSQAEPAADRHSAGRIVAQKGYDIREEAKKLEKLYCASVAEAKGEKKS